MSPYRNRYEYEEMVAMDTREAGMITILVTSSSAIAERPRCRVG